MDQLDEEANKTYAREKRVSATAGLRAIGSRAPRDDRHPPGPAARAPVAQARARALRCSQPSAPSPRFVRDAAPRP